MSVKKDLNKALANRPKYEISQEYFDNRSMAQSQAFGRDQAVQAQENNLEQDATNAIAQAGQYSNSASGILATLSSITSSKNQALRNLAADESVIQRSKMQDLYGANTAMAEEEDKAFEYNVNMPYQKKIERLQEKKRRRQLLTDSLTGVTIAAGGSAATSGTTQNGGSGNGEGNSAGGAFGFLGSIFSDERLKKSVEPTKYGLNEILDINVVEYEYITDPVPTRHVGVMAQNILDKVPEAVDQSGKYLKINYNELVPVLIKAMQEQQQLIVKMSQELSELKQSA